jgi:hypothetical protein
MVFASRIDSVIDIEGFVHLEEGTLWQAIEDTGLDYHEWVVRQEEGKKPRIHLYIEPKDGAKIDTDRAATAISSHLRDSTPFYGVLEDARDVVLEVTVLPSGAFQCYIAKQRAAGADLAHLKPPHMNPSDEIVDFLLNPVP